MSARAADPAVFALPVSGARHLGHDDPVDSLRIALDAADRIALFPPASARPTHLGWLSA